MEVILNSYWFDSVSLALAALGIVIAVVQSIRIARVENIRLTDVAADLNRIKTMILTNKDAVRINDVNNAEATAWIWKRQRGLSDHYVSLVRQYISAQKRFTFDDIYRLIETGVIDTPWQESVWREITSMRRENLKKLVPAAVLEGGQPDEWGRDILETALPKVETTGKKSRRKKQTRK